MSTSPLVQAQGFPVSINVLDLDERKGFAIGIINVCSAKARVHKQ